MYIKKLILLKYVYIHAEQSITTVYYSKFSKIVKFFTETHKYLIGQDTDEFKANCHPI